MKYAAIYLIAFALSLSLLFKPHEHNFGHKFNTGFLSQLARQQNKISRKPSSAELEIKDFFSRFDGSDAELKYYEAHSITMPSEVLGEPKKIYDYFKRRIADFVHPELKSAFDNCENVMCFYKDLYGDEQRARMSYEFFLISGIAISASNEVPDMTTRPSGGRESLKEFLFSTVELKFLLQAVASVANADYLVFPQSTLQSLHKLPMQFSKPNRCGYADGTHIVLIAQCMPADWHKKYVETREVPDASGKYMINLNQGISNFLHELGHCVDQNKGPDILPSEYVWIRDSKLWTSFSEPLQVSADGIIHYDDNHIKPGFISGYASTSYIEDFAESFAYYRFMPNETQAAIPEKYDFIKKRIFKGEGFTDQDLQKRFNSNAMSDYLATPISEFEKCLGQTDNSEAKPKFLGSADNLNSAELVCFEALINAKMNNTFEKIRFADPHFSMRAKDEWKTSWLNDNLAKIKQQALSVKSTIQLTQLRNELNSSLDSKEVFVSVWHEKSAAKKYREILQHNFDSYEKRFTEFGVDAKVEAELYLGKNKFETISDEVELLVKSQFQNQKNQIQKSVEETYVTCVQANKKISDETLFKNLDYRPSVKAEFSKCFESNILQNLPFVVRQVIEGSKIQSQSEDLYNYFLAQAKSITGEHYQAWSDLQRMNYEVAMREKLLESTDGLLAEIHRLDLSKQAILGRNDYCRLKMREFFYNNFFANSDLRGESTYANLLLVAEKNICTEEVTLNLAYQNDLEELKNKVSRRIFTLATQAEPKHFPIEKGFASFSVVDLEKSICSLQVSQLVAKDKELANLSKDDHFQQVVTDGIEETCLNGRYAGRFIWRRTQQMQSFGGIKSYGTAKFYKIPPEGMETNYYLFALRRYLGFRSSKLVLEPH